MNIGDIAKLRGLIGRPELNGEYVEILTRLEPRSMPAHNDAPWVDVECYGFELIRDPTTNGYMRPENLEPCPGVTRRGVEIHLFGWPRSDE